MEIREGKNCIAIQFKVPDDNVWVFHYQTGCIDLTIDGKSAFEFMQKIIKVIGEPITNKFTEEIKNE